MSGRTVRVVVADDNPQDIELFRTACEFGGIPADVTGYTDGHAALAVLTTAVNGAIPDVVVLDLNMPGLTGFEVLAALKASALRVVPVYILTTSSAPRDRERCARMGADRYLVKPTTFTAFVALLREALAGVPR